MRRITYLTVLLGLFVFAPVRSKDNVYRQLIDLEAHSGNGSILVVWEVPEKIEVKSARLYRTQNSFSNAILVFDTNTAKDRYLDKEVAGTRPYFYSIEIESTVGELFSSVVDAPPFAKPVLDYGLYQTLSQSEKILANYDYKTIDQFHDQILGDVLIKLLTTMDSNQVDIIRAMLFPIDAGPRSWISYAGFNGVSEFEGVFSNKSFSALRIELEDAMVRIGFSVKNQFLLTSAEWKNQAIKFTDRIMRRLFTVQDLLYQEIDNKNDLIKNWDFVTKNKPNKNEIENWAFAWACTKFVKSNAIIITSEKSIIGIGSGQPNRINSVNLAIEKAKSYLTENSILASDAFFPFSDSIELASKNNIRNIIQPGGSIRDNEVISEANRHNIKMIFTNTRHFSH